MIKPLFQRILVAYHNSDSSRIALMYAIMMAKQYKCRIKVVFVIDTATIKFLTLSKFMVQDESYELAANLGQDAERNFEFVKKLGASKGIKVETEVRHGAVWSEVVSAADEYNANLIVVGGISPSDNESALNKDVLSRQNIEILKNAHCSVMTVREKHVEQLFKLL